MRPTAIARIWLVSAAILVVGCATQGSEPVSTGHSDLVLRIGLDRPALPLAVSYRNLMTGLIGSAGFKLFQLYESGPPDLAERPTRRR